MHHAAWYSASAGVVRLLLQAGGAGQLQTQDEDGWVPLHRAAASSNCAEARFRRPSRQRVHYSSVGGASRSTRWRVRLRPVVGRGHASLLAKFWNARPGVGGAGAAGGRRVGRADVPGQGPAASTPRQSRSVASSGVVRRNGTARRGVLHAQP
jgi:hypothetical protein